MCDEWMKPLKLNITIDEFHRLPRNNAYKYEYFHDHALLSPRPKFYHALLDLDAFLASPPSDIDKECTLRPWQESDWTGLVPLFAGAFDRQQPFGSLVGEERREAARASLDRTRAGGDGPLIDAASLVALEGPQGGAVGGILITLLPDADPGEWGSFHWPQTPPADCVPRRLGRPHITWVFCHHFFSGHGVGTGLLLGAAHALHQLGYHQLASTFLPSNDSSVLWHWRNGFQLVQYPGSMRRIQRQVREAKQ